MGVAFPVSVVIRVVKVLIDLLLMHMDAAKRKYKKVEDVLDAVFALPSDVDESEDDLDGNSGSESCADDVRLCSSDDDSDDDDTLYYLADSDASQSSLSECDSNQSDSADDEEEWAKKPITKSSVDFESVPIVPTFPFLQSDSPADFFGKFFDDELWEWLVQQTNLYAKQTKIRCWHDVTVQELKAFVAIFIGIGLHQVPDVDLAWSTDPLFRIQPIADIMPIRRFKKIRQALHANDNSKAPKRGDVNFDKVYKVRPLVDKLNKEFMHQCVCSSSQSIDEAMILFKGRSSLKQYMPLKPIKRGYKVWIRSDSSTGYAFQFQIYTGKSHDGQICVGLGERVVLSLCEVLKDTYCHVTFDNFFTSFDLMEKLFSWNIYATGTVRANRKELPKLARKRPTLNKGEHKWRCRDHTSYVQWMDSKAVNLLSTAFDPETQCNIQRKQPDGTVVDLTAPEVVLEYTRRMGGVDRLDEKRGRYSVSRRSRRWWLRIFHFLLDCSITNANILYNSVHPEDSMTMLNFRTKLFRGLLNNYTSRRRQSNLQGCAFQAKRSTHSAAHEKKAGVPEDIRLQSVGVHMPQNMSTYRRCRLCSSRTNNKRSKIQCSVCQVALCVTPCFANFHK